MYYKHKKVEVSTIKQPEDKAVRCDYEKLKCEELSGIRGSVDKILDSRWIINKKLLYKITLSRVA